MITHKIARRLALVLFMVALQACGTSSPSHFYTLDTTATPEATVKSDVTVVVGPVTLPAAIDRPQFVVQVAPNQVNLDEFHRWAAPLDDNIPRVIAGNLAVLLGTPQVVRAPFASFTPNYRVILDIQRFETVPDKSALVEAMWVVRKTADGQTRSGHTLARESVQGRDYDALAAAHSRALLQVSRDIATAITAMQSKQH
jgi:uncharacterized lipoprotein YmbA